MAFKPPRKQPQFADLKGILAQTKDTTDNPLYQTVEQIIERLTQFQSVTLEALAGLESSILKNAANKFATYHTKNDETSILPNSWQLLEGDGIEFDDSIINERTISLKWYDAPLTDGNVDETDLIFALGECIIVQVPIP